MHTHLYKTDSEGVFQCSQTCHTTSNKIKNNINYFTTVFIAYSYKTKLCDFLQKKQVQALFISADVFLKHWAFICTTFKDCFFKKKNLKQLIDVPDLLRRIPVV